MRTVRRAACLAVPVLCLLVMIGPEAIAQGADARGASTPGGPSNRIENENPELSDLSCLDLIVEALDPEAESIGLTNELVKSVLLVAIKNKLPRVQVGECDSFLYVNLLFLLDRSGGGEVSRYSAYVPLQLVRGVTIGPNGDYFNATVWEMASLLGGTRDQGADKITKEIGQLMTRFASDYYGAGNP